MYKHMFKEVTVKKADEPQPIIYIKAKTEHSNYVISKPKDLYYHLKEHNYFNKLPPPVPTKTVKKNIKITELKAVFNCKACGYRTLQREALAQHKCVPKTKLFIPCTACELNKVPKGYLKCPKCTYFTKSKGSLRVHMRIHSKGTPYKCTDCDYSAKDLKELIKHYEETRVKDVNRSGHATHKKQVNTSSTEKPSSCSDSITEDKSGSEQTSS